MIEYDDVLAGGRLPPRRSLLGRVCRWFANLMHDRPASKYSPISPRNADGSHGPIFPFNGNGDSR